MTNKSKNSLNCKIKNRLESLLKLNKKSKPRQHKSHRIKQLYNIQNKLLRTLVDYKKAGCKSTKSKSRARKSRARKSRKSIMTHKSRKSRTHKSRKLRMTRKSRKSRRHSKSRRVRKSRKSRMTHKSRYW